MRLIALLVLVALLVPGTASANVPYPPNWPLTLDVQVTDCDGAGLPDTFLLEFNNGKGALCTCTRMRRDASTRCSQRHTLRLASGWWCAASRRTGTRPRSTVRRSVCATLICPG